MSLQSRVIAFQEFPVPEDIDEVETALVERILNEYAEEGRLDADPEQLEALRICIEETLEAGKEGSPASRAWFREALTLLQAIRADTE